MKNSWILLRGTWLVKKYYNSKNCARNFVTLTYCPFIQGNQLRRYEEKNMLFLVSRKPVTLERCVQSRASNVLDAYFWYFRENSNYLKTAVQEFTKEKFEKCESTSRSPNINVSILHVSPEKNENILPERTIGVDNLTDSNLKEIVTKLALKEMSISVQSIEFLKTECAKRVFKWPVDTSLYVLDALFIVLGEDIFSHYMFKNFLYSVEKNIEDITEFQLVQLLFILGVNKSAPKDLMLRLLAKTESMCKNIAKNEWGIICQALFKTKTKITSTALLNHIAEVTVSSLDGIDRFSLVSILKALRHAQFYHKQLVHKIQEYIAKNIKSFNFVECVHFMAMFSSIDVYSKDAFFYLEEQAVDNLKRELEMISSRRKESHYLKMHPSERIRVKDLARFLWSVSHVHHVVHTPNFFHAIYQIIDKKLTEGDYIKNPHLLLDSLQSLAVVEQFPEVFLKEVFKASFIQRLQKLKKKKPFHQLFFLHHTLHIEQPNFCAKYLCNEPPGTYGESLNKSLYKEIQQRPYLDNLMFILKACGIGEEKFKCLYCLPHIPIAGIQLIVEDQDTSPSSSLKLSHDLIVSDDLLNAIVGRTKPSAKKSDTQEERTAYFIRKNEDIDRNVESCTGINYSPIEKSISNNQENLLMFSQLKKKSETVQLEVLDEAVCIRNSSSPFGLMKVKLRQLSRLGHKVVLLNKEDIIKLLNQYYSDDPTKLSYNVKSLILEKTTKN
ncbi:FAST kinase domain-containing protein 5, mitochondrial [Tachypleus tridentatus]|uniref:FAST kinase domain-containing protein 5, mitochondrial n=1 Tax=Tachypleus tridentatus TaxID=6853 RepID=UPI003FD13258